MFTDGVPRQQIMQQFSKRQDRQITTLEILSIAIGLSTFATELSGRKVVVWSDNTALRPLPGRALPELGITVG